MFKLIDAGHGGVISGRYVTRGKQSPEVPPGIYEGAFNRRVAEYIQTGGMRGYVSLNKGLYNCPLGPRMRDINWFVKKEPDSILISIHANAAGKKGWSNASGARVFYPRPIWGRRRSEESRILAEFVEHELAASSVRGDLPYGVRPNKACSFRPIRGVSCPAVLVECGFMTNRRDAEWLAGPDSDTVLGDAIIAGADRFENWRAEQLAV